MDGLKGQNLLLLDSGNALFRASGVSDEGMRARARFILDIMGRLGTQAMAVGARDLPGGVDFLKEAATVAHVPLLSANLRRAGKPVFDASIVLTVGGVKVAIIGVSPAGPVAEQPDVSGEPTVDAVKAALAKLPKRDLTIVLAATTYADSMQLAQTFKDSVDFVIQSGEFRGTVPPQKAEGGSAYLLASGQRGQALSKVELTLGAGKGGFVDLSAIDRDAQQVAFVDQQLKVIDDRIAHATNPAGQKDLKSTRDLLRERRKTLQKSVDTRVAPTARSMKQTWVLLGSDVKDDLPLKAEVLKIEPTYAGSH